MSSESATTPVQDREESVNWRNIPQISVLFGLLLCIYGFVADKEQFAYSYLTAFMFCLSIGLGSLFLVLVHHLFDAGWSAPIRRYLEHLSCLLFPWLPTMNFRYSVVEGLFYQHGRMEYVVRFRQARTPVEVDPLPFSIAVVDRGRSSPATLLVFLWLEILPGWPPLPQW